MRPNHRPATSGDRHVVRSRSNSQPPSPETTRVVDTRPTVLITEQEVKLLTAAALAAARRRRRRCCRGGSPARGPQSRLPGDAGRPPSDVQAHYSYLDPPRCPAPWKGCDARGGSNSGAQARDTQAVIHHQVGGTVRPRWKAACCADLVVAAVIGELSPLWLKQTAAGTRSRSRGQGLLQPGDRHSRLWPDPGRHHAHDPAPSGAHRPRRSRSSSRGRRSSSPGATRRTAGPRPGRCDRMLRFSASPTSRIIVEDKANSTVQNAQFSVPLAEQAGTSGIILVTSTTHQDRADGNFVDARRQPAGYRELPGRRAVGQRRPVRPGRDQSVR